MFLGFLVSPPDGGSGLVWDGDATRQLLINSYFNCYLLWWLTVIQGLPHYRVGSQWRFSCVLLTLGAGLPSGIGPSTYDWSIQTGSVECRMSMFIFIYSHCIWISSDLVNGQIQPLFVNIYSPCLWTCTVLDFGHNLQYFISSGHQLSIIRPSSVRTQSCTLPGPAPH